LKSNNFVIFQAN